MKREGKIVLALIGSLWIAMPLYIILHEGGHALIASLCGAKITEFNIMEGYVIAEGGVFNEITLALFYAAGMLTPVTIFTIYLMLPLCVKSPTNIRKQDRLWHFWQLTILMRLPKSLFANLWSRTKNWQN